MLFKVYDQGYDRFAFGKMRHGFRPPRKRAFNLADVSNRRASRVLAPEWWGTMLLQGPRGETEGPPLSGRQDVVRTGVSLCPSGGQWPETEHKADGCRARGCRGAVVQTECLDSGDPALGS